MKKQFLLITIIMFLVSVVLSGCNSTEQTTEKTPDDLIIGNWYGQSQNVIVNYTFFENHSTCLTLGIKTFWTGYEITKDQIIITNLTDGSSTSYQYSFTDNNQKLEISSSEGEITILKRR